MKCREVIESLRELAPESCACDWDNPGLLAGRSDKEVRKVYLALDADDTVVEAVAAGGYDLLITHHPLIFRAIKQVNDQNFITRRLIRLIGADVSYFAMHTNFDAAPGCMADLAAERLGLSDCEPLEVLGEKDGVSYGIGKVGTLKEEMESEAFARFVKEAFSLPFALLYGKEQMGERIQKVAICPGAGASEVDRAIRSGAQILVTGDIGHHTGIDAAAQHLAILDAGHYGLEHIFMEFVAGFLRERFGEKLEIAIAPPSWPATLI